MGNADLVLRFYNEVANEGHVEVLDEILTGDFVLNGRPGQPAPPGPVPVRQGVEALRAAFSGLHFDVEDIVSQGDRVAARWTMRGRHTGEAFGNPPTGRDIAQAGMVFYRVAGNRLAEQWILADVQGLLNQIRPTAHPRRQAAARPRQPGTDIAGPNGWS
jgi:predicted ester cyclase